MDQYNTEEALEEAEALLRRVAALLDRVEWAAFEPDEIPRCPCCDRQTEWTGDDGSTGGGHARDCELAALKAELAKLR